MPEFVVVLPECQQAESHRFCKVHCEKGHLFPLGRMAPLLSCHNQAGQTRILSEVGERSSKGRKRTQTVRKLGRVRSLKVIMQTWFWDFSNQFLKILVISGKLFLPAPNARFLRYLLKRGLWDRFSPAAQTAALLLDRQQASCSSLSPSFRDDSCSSLNWSPDLRVSLVSVFFVWFSSHPCSVCWEILFATPSKYTQANLTLF